MSEPDPAEQTSNVAVEEPDSDKRGGVLWMLGLGCFAALLSCMFTHAHVQKGSALAEEGGMELSALTALYMRIAAFGFVVPCVLLVAGLGATSLGRVRHKAGLLIAGLLFAFALLWAGGAMVAFMNVYDPPRTVRRPSSELPVD
ncbi:MAG: hypothetical protein R3E76_13225 [Planctomycetota bacterium]